MQQPKWGFQIKIDDKWEWVAMKDQPPYEYDTRDEAYSMSYICYPDQWREQRLDGAKQVRIKEIKDDCKRAIQEAN